MEQNYSEKLLAIIHSDLSDDLLKEQLLNYHANDIAQIFEFLTKDERYKLYRIFPEEDLADIFSYLDDPALYLDELSSEKAADIIETMDTDDAIDILENLEEDNRQELIELMDKDMVAEIAMIKSYDDDMIGSKMTTNYIAIDKDSTIKQAMKKIVEEAAINDNISIIYFINKDNVFYGAMDLRDLIIAREGEKLEKLVKTSYPYLYATELVSECLNKIQDYALESIPVVDDDLHLIGVITSSDVVEVTQDELSDDYAKLAGLASEEDLKEPLFKSVKKRIPWLIILLVLGLVTSLLVSQFETVVAGLPIIVAFQSLILDMAGNCGTQSLAVTIRILTDEKISNKEIFKMIAKEIKVGIINGLLIGIVTLLFVLAFLYLTQRNLGNNIILKTSLAVGISMFTSMIVSSFVGTLMPIIFKKCKIDPAVASGPFITTINDIVAIVIYYGLSWIMIINFLS